MAYVHEIKFFSQEGQLYAALFDNPPFFCNEFWIKNIPAAALGIKILPRNLELEKKYNVAALGVEPFEISKPYFEFTDAIAKRAWEKGTELLLGQLIV